MDRLKLEFPTLARKEDAIEYIKEFDADGSRLDGTNRLKQYIDDYSSWIKRLEEDLKREPNEDRVLAETYFLVRESDNRKTMRALGGKMIYEYFDSKENTVVQNYVIDVKTSLETYGVYFSELIAEYPE